MRKYLLPASLALGIAFDLLFWKQVPGISFPIFMILFLMTGYLLLRKQDIKPDMKSLALLIRSGDVSLDHLSEFRIKLEGSIVELAAQRATREDLEGLCKLLSQAEGFARKGAAGSADFMRLWPVPACRTKRGCGNGWKRNCLQCQRRNTMR